MCEIITFLFCSSQTKLQIEPNFCCILQSLFIGVITMGMFESFEEMKAEIKAQQYQDNVDKNNSEEESELSKMLRAALVEDSNKKVWSRLLQIVQRLG